MALHLGVFQKTLSQNRVLIFITLGIPGHSTMRCWLAWLFGGPNLRKWMRNVCFSHDPAGFPSHQVSEHRVGCHV